MPPSRRVERAPDQVGERVRRDVRQVRRAAEGVLDQRGAVDERGVEPRGVPLRGRDGLGLVVEGEAGFEAEGVRVRGEVEPGAEEELAA